MDYRALLSEPVDAADSLFKTHRVPGKVVIHDHIAELEVKALAADLGTQQHLQIAVAELVHQCLALPHRSTTVHDPDLEAGVTQPAMEVSERQLEEREDEELARSRGSELLKSKRQGIELGVDGGKVVPHWCARVGHLPNDLLERGCGAHRA